jgi:hypothetical protein
MLPKIDDSMRKGFKLPYINGKLIVPILFLLMLYTFRGRITETFDNLGNNTLQQILFLLFLILAFAMSVLTFLRNYSLIPILGVLFCSYLLIEIPAISWIWFLCWMALGLAIYFLYGYRNSKLNPS